MLEGIWYRAAIVCVAATISLGLYGCGGGGDENTHSNSLSISVDTTAHGARDDIGIDKWELAAAQRALANLKHELYGQPMLDLIGSQVDDGDKRMRQYVSESSGQYKSTQVIVKVKGMKTATYFTELGNVLAPQSDPAAARQVAEEVIFPSHPEHYVFAPPINVETMGGVLTRSQPAYTSTSPDFVNAVEDQSYPIRRKGAATLTDGTVFTYVLQQWKDTADGMEGNLWIWYPAQAPSIYLEEHAEHYSVEIRGGIRLVAGRKNLSVTTAVETVLGARDDTGIDEWELAAARRALANLKHLLYGQPMLNLIGAQIEDGDNRMRQYVADSKGKYIGTQVIVHVRGIKTEPYFKALGEVLAPQADPAASQKVAEDIIFPSHPEHYVFAPPINVETMGGVLTRSKPAYTETSPDFVNAVEDQSYTIRKKGAATLADGTVFTYVLQQWKDTPDGMEGNLWIWYPAMAPGAYLDEHSEHYSVEMRNGVRLAFAKNKN